MTSQQSGDSLHPAKPEGKETCLPECTCPSGVWGQCEECGVGAWLLHACDFPCDDVTCENTFKCWGCVAGRYCPMHHGDDFGWESE